MHNFEITPDGHGFILSGELDMANAASFAAALKEALPAGGPCTVDMRKLRFMDSSGIQAIFAAARLAPEACIVLHGVHDQVQKVVELTGIDKVANLHVMPCTVGVPSRGRMAGETTPTLSVLGLQEEARTRDPA